MKNVIQIYLILFIYLSSIVSCKKDPEIISGCTDTLADTYNADATVDNGTCTYQKRFLGNYTGQFTCKGAFASVFNMAEISVTELVKKDEVNFIIQTTIGPIPVLGKLSKDSVAINSLLTDISIKPSDIIPTAGDDPIKVDGNVVSTLGISVDNKTLSGVLKIKLTTKEPLLISGFPIPAGFTLEDSCDFIATKN